MELEKGTLVLIDDLETLSAEARAGEFGDFTNNTYAAPKIALREKFLEMAEAVVTGKYD